MTLESRRAWYLKELKKAIFQSIIYGLVCFLLMAFSVSVLFQNLLLGIVMGSMYALGVGSLFIFPKILDYRDAPRNYRLDKEREAEDKRLKAEWDKFLTAEKQKWQEKPEVALAVLDRLTAEIDDEDADYYKLVLMSISDEVEKGPG